MAKWGIFQESKAISIIEKSINVIHYINKLEKKNYIVI